MYQLSVEDYLVVPKSLIPLAGTTFLDTSASKYQPFKNTFLAAVSLDEAADEVAEIGPATLRSQAG